MATSKGMLVRQYAISLVGRRYYLGEEPWYQISPVYTTSNTMDMDCSGLVYGVMRKSGVLWSGGGTFQRKTANEYYALCKKLTSPSAIGDMGFILNSSGKAVHVILYIGNGETVEARGTAYGVKRYSLYDKTNGAIARGAKWGRFNWSTGLV